MARVANGLARGARQAGAGALRKLRSVGGHDGVGEERDQRRWRVVTVNLPPDRVRPAELPPLARLGDHVEVTVRPAPGDKGTELAARLRDPEPAGLEALAAHLSGDDPRQAVRSALRQAKQLLETGEVLQANDNRTTEDTLTGKPLDLATARAGGEGRL